MEDKTPKTKKSVRRATKSSVSPTPCGPTGGAMDESPSTCGHMACTGGKCNVRYVGPVSHIRDHHVVHAARHASHIWSAAIVAGLAVVLTGALGYAAIGAESSGSMYGEFQQINHRLDKIEGMVKTLLDRCVLSSKCEEQAPAEDQCAEKCRQENGDNLEKTNACIRDMCQKPVEKPIADDSACRQTCESKYQMLDLTQEQIGEKVNACMAELCPAPVVDQCKADCQAKWGDNLDGTNQCITENCSAAPSAPLPTNMMDKTNPMEKPVTEEVSDACLDKCYNSRVMCFKEAGSNYTALRKCVSAEAQCKTACNKQ